MTSSSGQKPLAPQAPSAEVAAFVEAARSVPAPSSGMRGRLIFALDATMSRQATWDLAQKLQGRMFEAAAKIGGLDVQLIYFRGMNECRASKFVSGGAGLSDLMSRISVRGGLTQLRKVLIHARTEAKTAKVGALVFVGDAMEEGIDEVLHAAGELALAGVKAFMFQEGHDPAAKRAFQEVARLTGGAYGAFDAGSAVRLEALLRYDRPDEKISRTERLAERQARERRPTEDAWLVERRGELLAVITELSYEADRYGLLDEDREWLDELAIDARGDFTPATMVILGLAAAELRTAPPVLALEGTRPYAVHGLLGRADALRSAFAELGRKGARASGTSSPTRSA